ncbi:PaaI family thioesterase [Rhodovulum sp. 12E13]|uniref:PaaI family thioesterase n=1 Tax=Rhodovulum sp. 12E13 TaxID=2203891 RepID=UPI000E18EEE7|nr:PaaI family thioesterase [Rhodovulum sp. 12E13]RDC73134.1 PaaI family thioesterase [Rhodovulum sp. 12E13]
MTEDDRTRRLAEEQPPFARLMGLRLVSATPDRLVAEIEVVADLTNRNGTLHGGAVMAIADNLGGTATVLNIADDERTVTIESKTNFIRTVPVGDTVRAVTEPLHKGRTTMVWQTRIARGDGTLAAIVTQTQMVLRPGG